MEGREGGGGGREVAGGYRKKSDDRIAYKLQHVASRLEHFEMQ